jgi:hypothetical protein
MPMTAHCCRPHGRSSASISSTWGAQRGIRAKGCATAAKPFHAGDLAAVDARYEPFMLSRDPFRNFGIGDCELVEQFVREILPKFVTRGVRQDITCVPSQLSGSRFFVRGEVLKAAMRP